MLQPFGHHRDVESAVAQTYALLDVDVVRPVNAGNDLANRAIQSEDDHGPMRRGDLVGADNQAPGRVGGMNPDGRVIRVVGDRRRGERGTEWRGRRWF